MLSGVENAAALQLDEFNFGLLPMVNDQSRLARRFYEEAAPMEAVRAAYAAAGPQGATEAEIAAALHLSPAVVGRAALWLLKYDYLEEAP